MLRHSVCKSMMVTSLTLLLTGLVSCGQAESAYDQLVTDYQQSMTAMQEANTIHAASIASAADLQAATAEEDSHYADMQSMMDDMMGTTAALEQCGMMESMDMTGMMDSMQQELDAHHAAMLGADSLDTASQEESEHQATMDEMFNSMDDMSGSMSGMMGTGMDC